MHRECYSFASVIFPDNFSFFYRGKGFPIHLIDKKWKYRKSAKHISEYLIYAQAAKRWEKKKSLKWTFLVNQGKRSS